MESKALWGLIGDGVCALIPLEMEMAGTGERQRRRGGRLFMEKQ